MFAIYKHGNPEFESIIAIVKPSGTALESMTLFQVFDRDIPTGKNYKIISPEDIPADRNAWDMPDSEFSDGVGS